MTVVEMPLFPLNTVLFPGMPLSLHIFEERYKTMINACIAERLPFGVVLISQGTEALGPLADPNEWGCSAKITQVQPLPQKRMNLVAVGHERFRIVGLDRESQPYLVGKVEPMPMPIVSPLQLQDASERLREYVMRYLEILSQASDVQFDPSQLPEDPLALANFAAYYIRIEAEKKQRLLECATAGKFVRAVQRLYHTENALLQTMLSNSQKDDSNNPFSLN